MSVLWDYTVIELAVLAFASGSAIVGLFIGFLAYRGLKRRNSRQMLYLSVGLIMLFGVAYGISILGTVLLQFRVLPLPYQNPFRLTVRIVQFGGLILIAYSLYLGRGSDTPSTNLDD